MKAAFTLPLLVGFAAISLLGFLFMSPQDGHVNCIATALNGTACPPPTDLGFIDFHLDAFKKVSLTVVGSANLTAILWLLAAAATGLVFVLTITAPPLVSAEIERFIRIRDLSDYYRQERITNWLAFHENSPGIF